MTPVQPGLAVSAPSLPEKSVRAIGWAGSDRGVGADGIHSSRYCPADIRRRYCASEPLKSNGLRMKLLAISPISDGFMDIA